MNDETTKTEFPIGLYRDPRSGQFIGAIDGNQANAFIRVGYELYKEGRDAALLSQEDIDAIDGSKPAEGGQTYEPSTKKGK